MADRPEEVNDETARSVEREADTSGQSADLTTERSDQSVDDHAGDGHADESHSGGDHPTEFGERVAHAADAIERDRQGGLDPEQLREYTTDQRSLVPRVQVQWGVWTAVVVVVATLILTAVLNAAPVPPVLGIGVFVLLSALGAAWVRLRYVRWRYQVRTEALYLERGVVTHRRTLVPYVRIQHVDTSRGPLERALGLSTLVVYTAGSRGADVSIPGLTPEEATDLQRRVKELAIEAEGGDAL
jgi:membrane protein YdbS with pleckstrin-like domain